MGYFGHGQKYQLFFNILVFTLAYSIAVCNGGPAGSKNKKAKQFPNISFAVPVLGLFGGNTGGGANLNNLFQKTTATRTVIRTVATVTVPSFRTCTVVPSMFAACAGKRKRRDTDGEIDNNNLEGNDDNKLEELIYPSASMKVVIGTTEITDPVAVAQILHLNGNYNNQKTDQVKELLEATTGLPMIALERSEDVLLTTSNYPVYLDPSEDATTATANAAEVISEEAAVDDDALPSPDGRDDLGNSDSEIAVTTGETPYSDDINKLEDVTTTDSTAVDNTDEEDRGRLGVGNRSGGSTVTTTIPVTHVVSSAVTVPMSTLTVSYMGCSPPGALPIVTSACAP